MKIIFKVPGEKKEYALDASAVATADDFRNELKQSLNLDDTNLDNLLRDVRSVRFRSRSAEIENVDNFPKAEVLKQFPSLQRLNFTRITGNLPQSYLDKENTPHLRDVYQYSSNIGESGDRVLNSTESTRVSGTQESTIMRWTLEADEPARTNREKKAKVKHEAQTNPGNIDMMGTITSLITSIHKRDMNAISDIVHTLTGQETAKMDYSQLLNSAIGALSQNNSNLANLATTMLQTISNLGGLTPGQTSVDPVINMYNSLITNSDVPFDQRMQLLQGMQQYNLAMRSLSIGSTAPIFMGGVNVGGNFVFGNNNSFGTPNMYSGAVPNSNPYGYPSQGGAYSTPNMSTTPVGNSSVAPTNVSGAPISAQPTVSNPTPSAPTAPIGAPIAPTTTPVSPQKTEPQSEKQSGPAVSPEKPKTGKVFEASYKGLDRTSKPYKQRWIQRAITNHPVLSSIVASAGMAVGITAATLLTGGLGAVGIASLPALGSAVAGAFTASLGVIAPVSGALVAVGAIAGAGRRFTKMGRLRALDRKFERRNKWFKNQENKFSHNMTRIKDLDNRIEKCNELLNSGKISEYQRQKTGKELENLTTKRITVQNKLDKNYNKMRNWNGRANHYGEKLAEKEQKYGKTLAYGGLVNQFAKYIKSGDMESADKLQKKYAKKGIDLQSTYQELTQGTYQGTRAREMGANEDKLNKATNNLEKIKIAEPKKSNKKAQSKESYEQETDSVEQSEPVVEEKCKDNTNNADTEQRKVDEKEAKRREIAEKKQQEKETRQQEKENRKAEKASEREARKAEKAREKEQHIKEREEEEKLKDVEPVIPKKQKETVETYEINETEHTAEDKKAEQKEEITQTTTTEEKKAKEEDKKEQSEEQTKDNTQKVAEQEPKEQNKTDGSENSKENVHDYEDNLVGDMYERKDLRAELGDMADNMVAMQTMDPQMADVVKKYAEKGYLDTIPQDVDPIEVAKAMASMPIEKQQEIMERVRDAGSNPATVGLIVASEMMQERNKENQRDAVKDNEKDNGMGGM